MKPCWAMAGLTEESAVIADATIGRVVDLVADIGDAELVRILLAEASFRLFELPTRTPEFQEKYAKDNGVFFLGMRSRVCPGGYRRSRKFPSRVV
jgi:hypothetical protein